MPPENSRAKRPSKTINKIYPDSWLFISPSINPQSCKCYKKRWRLILWVMFDSMMCCSLAKELLLPKGVGPQWDPKLDDSHQIFHSPQWSQPNPAHRGYISRWRGFHQQREVWRTNCLFEVNFGLLHYATLASTSLLPNQKVSTKCSGFVCVCVSMCHDHSKQWNSQISWKSIAARASNWAHCWPQL